MDADKFDLDEIRKRYSYTDINFPELAFSHTAGEQISEEKVRKIQEDSTAYLESFLAFGWGDKTATLVREAIPLTGKGKRITIPIRLALAAGGEYNHNMALIGALAELTQNYSLIKDDVFDLGITGIVGNPNVFSQLLNYAVEKKDQLLGAKNHGFINLMGSVLGTLSETLHDALQGLEDLVKADKPSTEKLRRGEKPCIFKDGLVGAGLADIGYVSKMIYGLSFLQGSSKELQYVQRTFGELWSYLVEGETLDCLAEYAGRIGEPYWEKNHLGDVSLELYKEIIYKKTAVPFEKMTEMQLRTAKVDDNYIAAGRNFGLAFGLLHQITDDWCDYFGNYEILKKEPGDDIQSHKGSNIVTILLLNSDFVDADDKKFFKSILFSERVGAGQKDEFLARAKKYKSNLKEELTQIIDSLNDQTLTALNEFPDNEFRKSITKDVTGYIKKRFYSI